MLGSVESGVKDLNMRERERGMRGRKKGTRELEREAAMAGGKIRKEKPKAKGTSAPYQGGISFHKSKGQHILKNPMLVDTIVQKSGIKSTVPAESFIQNPVGNWKSRTLSKYQNQTLELEDQKLLKMKIDSEYEYEFEIAFCGRIGPSAEWYAMKVTEPYFRSSSSAKYKYGKNKEARSIVSKKELLVPISVSKFSCSCRRGLPVAVLGSHMYCLGPIVSNPSSNSNQVWTLDLTSSSNCWKPGPHTNFTRWNPHVMVLDNKLYALGSCHPDFEAESSGCGWMEVFHPKLGTWESLPNPPSRCFLQRIMLSAPLHDKKQIVVAERCNGRVTFHIYNVETRRWATLDPPRRDFMSAQFKGRDGFPNDDTISALRPAVVGNTLYWGFLDDQKLCLQAYNLDTDVWFYGRLDLCSSVLWKGEFLPCQLSTSLHHLAHHKFCFLFLSLGRGSFLNCLIFDVSPISRKNYHYHANDEDDDFSRNLYSDGWDKDRPFSKAFSKLGISIVSIHKYPVHGRLRVHHTVLLDAGFYTSERKKPKLSRKPIESPTCRDARFYAPKMKKPKSSHKP